MRQALMTAVLAAVLASGIPAAAWAAPEETIAAAAANPERPDKARALDESRKPTEVLAFLGLEPGMAAADLMTGSGYWAEIMANVVGPKGSVTAFEPVQFYSTPEEQAEYAAMTTRMDDVHFVRHPFEAFDAAPGSFDFAMINLSYHDLYWESEQYRIPRTDPAAFLSTLYAAMRPGGIVGVVDHVGPAGDTRAVVDKMHRIDPAVVRADFEAAGFVLEAESPLLANPADDHSMMVFNPAIRGKTDRFTYRFRKPAA